MHFVCHIRLAIPYGLNAKDRRHSLAAKRRMTMLNQFSQVLTNCDHLFLTDCVNHILAFSTLSWLIHSGHVLTPSVRLTDSELALLYNDSSVLENHHLFVAFNLLHNEPECDFSAQFSRTQRQLFRKMVISLVSAGELMCFG